MMSTRRLISSGSVFEAEYGYSRVVVDGDWAFVAGTTGFDYGAGTISEDPVAQARQTLRNIDAALGEAGFSMADIVRANYIVTDAENWPAIGRAIGEIFHAIRPASTAIVAGLVDPRMKIEIEVTAKRRRAVPRDD